jgi:hypothetical protein
MPKHPKIYRTRVAGFGMLLSAILLASGCTMVGQTAADLGLAGAGGVAGYHLSNKKVGGAVAGAAVGYVASKITQHQMQQALDEAEKRGFDRALNQAVKQQYWIIQNQQRSREDAAPEPDARLVPIVIPPAKVDGVQQNTRVEYLRLSP